MFILGIQTSGPVRTRKEVAAFLLDLAEGLLLTDAISGSAVDNITGRQFASFSYDVDCNPDVMAVRFGAATEKQPCSLV